MSQVDGNACIPLEGVLVDVWHCDALGNYSDVGSEQGHDYLRGYQHTDANGKATDHDHLPGLVPGSRRPHPLQDPDRCGRRRAASSSPRSCSSTTPSATQVYRPGVYASKGTPDQPNASDGIYQQSQGMTLLDVAKDGDGYKATFEIAVQTT